MIGYVKVQRLEYNNCFECFEREVFSFHWKAQRG
jgi:hypothetical protein